MKKIQITSTVFYHLVNKIKQEICLGYINNVQTIDKNIWKIKIHLKKTKDLIVTPDVLFMPEYSFEVSEILGFEKYLKKKLYNQRIHQVYQDKNNKVMVLKLDSYHLIFEFFSKSNVILTDSEFNIITSKQKEEWKDRTIQKGVKYLFPQGETFLDKKEIIKKEIEKLDKKEIIKILSKKYNLAPVEINEIVENGKKIIDAVFKSYETETPGVEKIVRNDIDTFIFKENGKDLFKTFEDEFKSEYEKKEVSVENKKKDKTSEVLRLQENKKKEFEEKIKVLEKEGEFIYANFSLVDIINKQIEKAVEKKISEKEIILKINNYFLEKNINLKINGIDQKTKTYQIEEI